MATVNSYPVKTTVGLDDYVCIGKHDSSYKIKVADIIANLQSGKLKSNMGASNVGKVLTIDIDGNVTPVNPVT